MSGEHHPAIGGFEGNDEATRMFQQHYNQGVLHVSPDATAGNLYDSSDGELAALAPDAVDSQGNPFNLDDIPVMSLGAAEEEFKGFMESNRATACNLSTVNFAGEFQFDVKLKTSNHSKEPQFSEKLGKLFINQNRMVQVFFSLAMNAGVSLFIRAVAVFLGPDHISSPVTVCHLHSRNSEGQLKGDNAEHLVKCSAGDADAGFYLKDKISGRHSVLMPVPEMSAGSDDVFLTYKFSDLGSCVGGINRRETAVVFTLENERYEVVGRKVVPVRICTSTKRDLISEEAQFDKKNGSYSEIVLQTTDKRASGQKRKAFWVLAYGKDNYEALRNVGELLEKKDTGRVQEYKDIVDRFNSEGCSEKKPKLQF